MTTVLTHRTLIALKLPQPVPALIKLAQAIQAGMTNNPHFPSPVPPLATITASITTLDAAETATQTRAKGTVPTRNAARLALVSNLRALAAHVQQVADADPEQSEVIINSAGMSVRQAPNRAKPTFAVRQGTASGSVKLSARAVALRAAYEWEWSSDGGKTWTPAPPTLQSRTSISGLPVGTSVQFRYRSVTKTGPADWSQPTSLLVT